MPGVTSYPLALDTFPAIDANTQEDGAGVEHDVVHANEMAAIAALQAKVGIDGSADASSIDARVAALEGEPAAPATSDELAEGATNLYFTAARVRDVVLSGLSLVSSTVVAATDSILVGIGKLQAQITSNVSAIAGKISSSEKGAANGVAPLGSDAKISTTYLPVAVLGQVSYQSTWNASTGTPPTASPQKGWYYIVSVAGTTSLSGITSWEVGDWAIFDGAAWEKVDNTDAVSAVAGLTGVISASSLKTALSLSKADVGLGSVDNTSDASKPVSVAQAAADTASKDRANHTGTQVAATISDLAAAVRGVVLTGLSTATNAVIAATDSVLVACGKLQAQISANLSTLTAHAANAGNPHGVTKAQVGLGSVDNTSDASKPISTQTQAALDTLIPAGYIDGLSLVWVSATALTVSSGAACIQSTGKVLRVGSDIAKSGLSLAASAFAHVYLYDNGGTPDVEISATVPGSAYVGNARSKSADASRRYIGSVLADASGQIVAFQQSGNQVRYLVGCTAAPFRILSGGGATSFTSVSASGAVPSTARIATLFFNNVSATAGMGVGVTSQITVINPKAAATIAFPLTSSQALGYLMLGSSPTSAYIDVLGYELLR